MTHYSRAVTPQKRFCLRQIYGDCLEKLGIRNVGGGYAIIDKNAIPKVGDVVHCLKGIGNVQGYLKQVKRIEGDSVIVGTAYLDEKKDYEFEASEILGVVLETYGKTFGWREYERPKEGTDNEQREAD